MAKCDGHVYKILLFVVNNIEDFTIGVGSKHGLWVLILLRDLVVKVFHCMIGVSNCGTYCHFILNLSLSYKPWLPDYYTGTLIAKGYTKLPKGLEMSRSLIVNMKLIANISG